MSEDSSFSSNGQALPVKHQFVVSAHGIHLHDRDPGPHRHFPEKPVAGFLLVDAPGGSRKVHQEIDPFLGQLADRIPAIPPNRQPFNIVKANSRIGSTSIPCDPKKIVAIVESKLRDQGRAFAEQDDTSEAIAGHVIDFFQAEVKAGRLPDNLLPIQSGVGSIANAVIGGLAKGPFYNLSVYTEVLQDTMLDFFDGGNLNFASACSLRCWRSRGMPTRRRYSARTNV